jgi:hypothetical protein
MRSAVVTLLVLCAAGLAGLLVVASQRDTSLAFTLGVTPGAPVPAIEPGGVGCQGPIDVPEGGAFDAVELPLGTFERPGPALVLTVRDPGSGAVLARGALPAGYRDVGDEPQQQIAVRPRVEAGTRVVVCLRNAGRGPVAPFGNADVAAVDQTYTIDGEAQGVDAALVFRQEPRSLLSRFALIVQRAALFRPGWVGAWTYWLLAALVVLGLPALLAFALARAGAADEDAAGLPSADRASPAAGRPSAG